MYNEGHKQSFLKKIKPKDLLAKELLASSERFEENNQKDICQFSIDELNQFLGEEIISKNKSLYRAVQTLKQYNRYCKHRQYNTTNACSKIKTDLVDEVHETLFASPLHLASQLDLVFSKITEDNVDMLIRCFLWMAFSEMDANDIPRVKRDNVDLMERCIIFGDRSYRIYEEAYKTFERVCTLQSFKVPIPKGHIYTNRSNPMMLLSGMERGEYRPELKLADFRARISAIAASSGIPFSYNTSRLSGMFYRVYCRERAGLIDDLEDEFWSFDGRGAKIDTPALERSIKRTRKGLLEKYKAWKKAFNV